MKVLILVVILYRSSSAQSSRMSSLSSLMDFELIKSWSVKCKTNKLNEQYSEVENDRANIYDKGDAKVTISDCLSPNTSYAEFLGGIGFDVKSLETLKLKNIKGSPLKGKHFLGLSINKLELSFYTNRYQESLDQNIFYVLPKLTAISVQRIKVPPIPSHLKIVDAEFSTGLFSDGIGTCDELKKLLLESWDVRMENLLSSCSRLTTLTLSRLSDGTATRVVSSTRSAKSLTQLKINHCGLLKSEPISLEHMVDLVNLDLSNNFLANLEVVCSLPLLRRLYLNDNIISAEHYEIVALFQRLPQLQVLEVAYNQNFDFCKNNGLELEHKHVGIMHPHLQSLVLTRTKSSFSCLGPGVFPSLEYLDLKSHDILVIQFQEFQISRVALSVNLLYNFPKKVIFTKADYYNKLAERKYSTKNTTIVLYGSIEVECDCQHGSFAEALRENLVIAPHVHCKYDRNKTHLTAIPHDQLKCDKYACGGCTCRSYWTNSSVEANCSDAKVNKIPKVKGLSKLIAPFNRIVLNKIDIPDTLTFLDLRSNEILYVNEEVTKVLFSIPKRKMLLSGNPILCNCENFVFIQYLQRFSKQIEDYDSVKCEGNGIAIHEVILSELCKSNGNLQAALAAGGAVLIVALLVTVIYCRFGSSIHMFLYARGWLCCINEEKLDADRLFDAFVSYCFTDGVAADEIVSWLEEHDFKVCVHYRDWMPGEMIPTQIVRSVEVSRRTVILLSQKFTESIWGLLEFRTAHARALKEGVMRVILVVLDDVVENTNLDDDLRRYIRLNTYVRYDDPWFWDKLYYAMPRRQPRPNTSIELATVQNELPNVPAITYEST